MSKAESLLLLFFSNMVPDFLEHEPKLKNIITPLGVKSAKLKAYYLFFKHSI